MPGYWDLPNKYRHGGYHGTVMMGGRTLSGGGGDSAQNKGTGEKGSSGQTEAGDKEHKLLTAYNKLVAEGKEGTVQAKELGRYLGRVEQKYQSEGRSLQGDFIPPDAELHKPTLSSEDIINQLASLEAGDPKYAKSFAGQEFIKSWEKAGYSKEEAMASKSWRDKFGMGQFVTMPTYSQEVHERGKGVTGYEWEKDPIRTGITGDYIYSGLGKSMMDQFEGSVAGRQLFEGDAGAYQQAKDTYWADREAAERTGQEPTRWGGYGGGGGGGGGYGYEAQPGYKPEQMVGFYTPQANLQQAMVNVHQTPTGFQPGYKRGGIVSLLGLRS